MVAGDDTRMPSIPRGWMLDDGLEPFYIEESDLLAYYLRRDDE